MAFLLYLQNSGIWLLNLKPYSGVLLIKHRIYLSNSSLTSQRLVPPQRTKSEFHFWESLAWVCSLHKSHFPEFVSNLIFDKDWDFISTGEVIWNFVLFSESVPAISRGIFSTHPEKAIVIKSSKNAANMRCILSIVILFVVISDAKVIPHENFHFHIYLQCFRSCPNITQIVIFKHFLDRN